MAFYYATIFYCIYDLIFVHNDSSDNLAIIDVMLIIGCLICLEIRKLGNRRN